MNLEVITAPAVEPATLAEAKLHCRVDLDLEDDLITSLIAAARDRAEKYSRRAFVTQQWKLRLDAWPMYGEILIPLPPLQSIESIQYYDTGGALQTVDSSLYYVAPGTPGRARIKSNQSWPDLEDGRPDAVIVNFTAGYGDTAADLPAVIKPAVLLMVGHLYRNRESTTTGSAAELPEGVRSLLGTLNWGFYG